MKPDLLLGESTRSSRVQKSFITVLIAFLPFLASSQVIPSECLILHWPWKRVGDDVTGRFTGMLVANGLYQCSELNASNGDSPPNFFVKHQNEGTYLLPSAEQTTFDSAASFDGRSHIHRVRHKHFAQSINNYDLVPVLKAPSSREEAN